MTGVASLDHRVHPIHTLNTRNPRSGGPPPVSLHCRRQTGPIPVLCIAEPPARPGLLDHHDGFNSGGRMKDRPATHMAELSPVRGELQPGARIGESTSGNLGLGLALTSQTWLMAPLFATSILVAVTGRLRVTRWFVARRNSGRSPFIGMMLAAASFVPLLMVPDTQCLCAPAAVGAPTVMRGPARDRLGCGVPSRDGHHRRRRNSPGNLATRSTFGATHRLGIGELPWAALALVGTLAPPVRPKHQPHPFRGRVFRRTAANHLASSATRRSDLVSTNPTHRTAAQKKG